MPARRQSTQPCTTTQPHQIYRTPLQRDRQSSSEVWARKSCSTPFARFAVACAFWKSDKWWPHCQSAISRQGCSARRRERAPTGWAAGHVVMRADRWLDRLVCSLSDLDCPCFSSLIRFSRVYAIQNIYFHSIGVHSIRGAFIMQCLALSIVLGWHPYGHNSLTIHGYIRVLSESVQRGYYRLWAPAGHNMHH